jgi:hypothetical protein
MLSVTAQQVIAARNRIVDAWIEDLLAAHEAPATSNSRNQRPSLPKFYSSSPAVPSDETPSSLSHAPHPTNRRGKRKAELYLLQNIDPNMNPTPKRGVTNPLSRKAQRKSAKTEKNVEAQREEAPGPERARVTRSASALVKAKLLDNQVHLPPPLDMAYTSAIDTNAALASGPGFELPSVGPQSIDPPSIKRPSTKRPSTKAPSKRSKSPVKSMADLSLTSKPIQLRTFGKGGTQLPLDVRELCGKLKALTHGKETLPTVIKVSALAG